MFGKLLFFFVFPKLGISYKEKKSAAHSFLSFLLYIGQYQAYCGSARSVAKQYDPICISVDQLYPLIDIIKANAKCDAGHLIQTVMPSFQKPLHAYPVILHFQKDLISFICADANVMPFSDTVSKRMLKHIFH